jgi:hypothetical protein
MCYLPRCQCPAKLSPYMVCIIGDPPPTPRRHSTYDNETFLTEATYQNFNKYAFLQPLLSQQGWEVVPPIIITTDIKGPAHTPSVKQLHELHIPTHNIHTWKNDHKLQYNTSHISTSRKENQEINKDRTHWTYNHPITHFHHKVTSL